MKKTALKLTLLALCFTLFQLSHAQSKRINPHAFELGDIDKSQFTEPNLTNDENINVHFYHLTLNIGVPNPDIQGSVAVHFTAVNNITSVAFDLDEALTVYSMEGPVESFEHIDNAINVELNQEFEAGEIVELVIYYGGTPPLAGGFKGLRYETHNGDEPIIASLSTPYLAHTWWPCKDGTLDKADSVYIDIAIPNTLGGDIPYIAVSNGVLENSFVGDATNFFQWRHRYPIVPYYVMVAISNYQLIEQEYNVDGYEFPLEYYVFNEHVGSATEGVADMPDVMAYFSEIFGPYPFADEKYGMTQLGYYGGIENQTNSIINNMSLGWFNVSVHELAHMWFADMITCETWHEGWLNEGFASYAEALYEEHANDFEAYKQYMIGFEWFTGGTIYSDDISDPFTLFQSIWYNKGPYVLHMLRGVMGDEAFFEAVHQYATTPDYMYANATIVDFQDICESVSGLDLNTFFEQWIYDEYYPQYEYNYTQSDGELQVQINQNQEDNGWRPVFEMPVPLHVTYADGTQDILIADNNLSEQGFSFDIDQEVTALEFDPDKWILRSVNFNPDLVVNINTLNSNNALVIYPNPNAGTAYFEVPDALRSQQVQIQVMDAQGKVVLRKSTTLLHNTHQINMESLSDGLYSISISNDEVDYVGRLVK